MERLHETQPLSRAGPIGPLRGSGNETKEEDERALVRRLARGDEEAVVALYRAYADPLFRFVYRRVEGCYEDAQEIIQDAFLAAIACAPTYDGSCAVFTWLCGIAKLRITDFFRKRGRRKRIPAGKTTVLRDGLEPVSATGSAWETVDQVAGRVDAFRLVDRAMARLNDDEREALLLRYVEEFTVREIAALLGRTEKAVESLLIRAKKKAARAAVRSL